MSRAYDELPEGVRALDAQQSPARPLAAYVDSIGGQLDDIAATVSAIAPPAGQRSLLVDPMNAPASWLPWMAQLVGSNLAGTTTTAQQRAAVAGAGGGWLAGTMQAIISAVRATLTDPIGGYVAVTRDTTSMWLLHISTKAIETPSIPATLAAVLAAGAKPAGVVLDWSAYVATWDAIEAHAPTWASVEALGSWDALEAVG